MFRVSSDWPTPEDAYVDDNAEQQFGLVQAVITAVRTIRAEYHVPPGATLQAEIAPATAAAREAVHAEQHTVRRLSKVSELIVVERNRDILQRDDYADVTVSEGDVLELVHFVGGG